jgi:iron complex outermembrane receptor protein
VASSLIWAALPGAAAPQKEYNEMTLEELLQLDVTSVSKTEERRFDDVSPFDADAHNGNLLTRWSRQTGRGRVSAQLYYDHSERNEKVGGEHRNTVDLELQQDLSLAGRHDVSLGLGARSIRNQFFPVFAVNWDPVRHNDELYVLFAQDRIRFRGGKTQLFVGSKLEYTDRGGYEAQPSIRLTQKTGERQVLWAAVSRAVRTPSRVNYDLRSIAAVLPTPGLPTFVVASGNHNIDSEKLIAAELGYRFQPTRSSLVDVALFHHDYKDLIQNASAGPPFPVFSPPPAHVVVPLVAVNQATAESYGVEIATDVDVTSSWRIAANYSYLHLRTGNTKDNGILTLPLNNPQQQVKVLSRHDLPGNVELSTSGSNGWTSGR